jgi:CBS domain-containing protein
MRTIETIHRSGVGIGPDRTIREAAKIMTSAGVGSLAVLEQNRLVGIVTDRDLVRRCLAHGIEPGARVDSAMTTPVVTIQADADVHDAFGLFRTHAVRRLAVMRGEQFVGMLAIDDLLVYLAADLADLARPITAEILFAHRDSPVPATT